MPPPETPSHNKRASVVHSKQTSATASSLSSSPASPEQLRRAELNRQRALELRALKASSSQMSPVTASAAVTPVTAVTGSAMTAVTASAAVTPRGPSRSNVAAGVSPRPSHGTTLKPTTASSKPSTPTASREQQPQHQPTLTPDLLRRAEANRQRALELRAAKKRQKSSASGDAVHLRSSLDDRSQSSMSSLPSSTEPLQQPDTSVDPPVQHQEKRARRQSNATPATMRLYPSLREEYEEFVDEEVDDSGVTLALPEMKPPPRAQRLSLARKRRPGTAMTTFDLTEDADQDDYMDSETSASATRASTDLSTKVTAATTSTAISSSAQHTVVDLTSADFERDYDQLLETLSDEQRRVLELAVAGENVFFTGSAGVGKSYLLKLIVATLRTRGKRVVVTAPTGIAALQIGGQTVHSFSGIGLGGMAMRKLLNKVKGDRNKVKAWRKHDVLVLDEISMLSDVMLETLDLLARHCRDEVGKPFGGMQLVFCGDFFQLPPVEDNNGVDCPFCGHKHQYGATADDYVTCAENSHTCQQLIRSHLRYAFESAAWTAAKLHTVELTKVFRQADAEFVGVLNEIRRGKVSESAKQLLRGCERKLPEDNILPTRLYPHLHAIEAENQTQYRRLPNDVAEFRYTAVDGCNETGRPYMSVLKQHQAEPELSLKIGTQVFLLVNVALGRGLVNGSRGVVVGFTSDIESSMKSWTEDKSEAASSRYRQEVRDWFERNPGRQLPVVQFKSCTITVAPHAWTLDWMPRGGRVWRKQIPLKHAWAISMHKSQGMSLDKLTVELKNVFAHGQAYVALSRARSLDGLQVDKFDVHVVKAHPKVVAFYEQIAADASTRASSLLLSLPRINSSIVIDLTTDDERSPTKGSATTQPCSACLDAPTDPCSCADYTQVLSTVERWLDRHPAERHWQLRKALLDMIERRVDRFAGQEPDWYIRARNALMRGELP